MHAGLPICMRDGGLSLLLRSWFCLRLQPRHHMGCGMWVWCFPGISDFSCLWRVHKTRSFVDSSIPLVCGTPTLLETRSLPPVSRSL